MKHPHTVILVLGLLSAAAVTQAQQAPNPPQGPAGSQQSAPQVLPGDTRDARETRERLRNVLDQYPPSVREVLRIDPTLMSHEYFLATYPVLAAFLRQHPEVAHNPTFFVGESRIQEENRNDPAAEAFRSLSLMIQEVTVVLIIATITGGVIWLVRTVIEQRRWQRVARTQMDLHTKLIDRFSSSEELLAYLQSPAGKILTETPSLPQSAPRIMSAPLSRIFWSLQSGLVIGALGTGLILVSRTAGSPFADVLYGVGIVVLTIGVGFTVSAAVSYVLSERLGLVQSLSTRHSGEAPT